MIDEFDGFMHVQVVPINKKTGRSCGKWND